VTTPRVDDAFPSLVVHPERVLFRLQRSSNQPVHFSSSGHGRFDLVAVAGVGTCYVAPSPLGAYVEIFGRLGTITWDDIEERSLTELTLARSLKLADLTERSVLGRYGLAGDISTGTDYGPSQKLAGRLYELGFDGIYYTARHDPAFLERSVAVFGGSGDRKLFATLTTVIPEALVDQAAREFGLLVLPSP
jgi:hypothetical protein